MKHFTKCLLAVVSATGLVACGGSDTEDRLDLADPVVRFVHASPLATNLSLYRNDVVQGGASNAAYKSASNYFYSDTETAQWSVKTAPGNVLVGSIPIDAKRGNRYTVVALPSGTSETTLYEIRDPYNKSLTSDKAKVRMMNASFNASNIDVYFNALNTDISPVGILPAIAGTNYKTSGPLPGNDSLDIEGGSYQIAITAAGSKTILFKGVINIERNKDILLLTVPNIEKPSAVRTLIKLEGAEGMTELSTS
jgi:Domain of unknown function (DUF4397)